VRTVLPGIAEGEVIERGGHDLDAFVPVAAADEDDAELATAFCILFAGVVIRRATGGVFSSHRLARLP